MVLDHLKSFDGTGEVPHISSLLFGDEDMFEDGASGRPYVLVVSANDETSLRSYCKAMDRHLSRLDVNVRMPDLAYTLSERRTHHFHRAYAIVCNSEVNETSFQFGKKSNEPPRIGFVFTGQGAQWFVFLQPIIPLFTPIGSPEIMSRSSRAPPEKHNSDLEKYNRPQMGKALIENFPTAKPLLEELDHTLQQLPDSPSWSLVGVYSFPYQVHC